MGEQPAPGGEARTLDQGLSSSCTSHALANAIADLLIENGINVVQEHLVSVLVSHKGHVGRIWPDAFHNLEDPILTMDQSSGKWIKINLKDIKEIDISEVDTSKQDRKHVLAYKTTKTENARGMVQWIDYHCVFLKAKSSLNNNAFCCINSWGNKNGKPVIEQSRDGNKVYIVKATWEIAPEGPPDYETMTKGKIFYLKLDLIGQQYIKEYEDHSSEQFETLCGDIKKEVAKVYKESSIDGFKSVEVLKIWNGSNDAKEVRDNVLLVELVLNMQTNKSHALAPLRTGIVDGKLGKFDFADFLDVCEVSLDPLKGSVLSKIYTVEGKTGNIDGIMETIWKNKGIESDKYHSIKEEDEKIKKSKKFYFDYILECKRQGFELLLRAIQESEKENNNSANYGECITGQRDIYDMNAGYKGIFLLIDNKSTVPESVPEGGKVLDASAMKTLFNDLKFIVRAHRNLTADQMINVFKDTVSMYEEDAYCRGCNFTAFAACIITKGGESKKDLYGADNTSMGMQDIIEIMKGVPSFKIIPKVVIFQFYRGSDEGIAAGDTISMLRAQSNEGFTESYNVLSESNVNPVESRGLVLNPSNSGSNEPPEEPPGRSSWWDNDRQQLHKAADKLTTEPFDDDTINIGLSIPTDYNFIVVISTVTGDNSLENNGYSSWFIQGLVEEFRTKEKKTDIIKILDEIKNRISSKLDFGKKDQNYEDLIFLNGLGSTLYLNGMGP